MKVLNLAGGCVWCVMCICMVCVHGVYRYLWCKCVCSVYMYMVCWGICGVYVCSAYSEEGMATHSSILA